MNTCEVCQNDYERCLKIELDGEVHVFDCFECAIHALAPNCEHCGCRIIGHGVQDGELIYCCAHCARAAGATPAGTTSTENSAERDAAEQGRRRT